MRPSLWKTPKFPDREIRRPPETRARPARLADAREREGAQLLAREVEAEEIPLVINAAEMIRPHPPDLGRGAAQLAITKFHLGRIEHSVAEQFENFQIGLALPDAAKRDRRVQFAPAKTDFVLQAVPDFDKGGAQRRFEWRAVILLERLLRDEESDDFALRNLNVRKTRDRLGVDEPEVELIVLDRKPELITHELDVALNRFLRHFELVRELAAIGKPARLELGVELHHAREWRPGKLLDRRTQPSTALLQARLHSCRTWHVRPVARHFRARQVIC